MTRCEKPKMPACETMQIGEDADLAQLDHVLAEAGEIARAGAAGVDRRGDARRPSRTPRRRCRARCRPNRRGCADRSGRASRCNRETSRTSVAGSGLELVSDRSHLTAREGDIGHGIELLGRVDHPTPAQDQIRKASWSPDIGRAATEGASPDPRSACAEEPSTA